MLDSICPLQRLFRLPPFDLDLYYVHLILYYSQEEGANITVNSVHPGMIMTNLMRHSYVRLSMLSCSFFSHGESMFWSYLGTLNFRQCSKTPCFSCRVDSSCNLLWKNVPQVGTRSSQFMLLANYSSDNS